MGIKTVAPVSPEGAGESFALRRWHSPATSTSTELVTPLGSERNVEASPLGTKIAVDSSQGSKTSASPTSGSTDGSQDGSTTYGSLDGDKTPPDVALRDAEEGISGAHATVSPSPEHAVASPREVGRKHVWLEMLKLPSTKVDNLYDIVNENQCWLDSGVVMPCAPSDEEKASVSHRVGRSFARLGLREPRGVCRVGWPRSPSRAAAGGGDHNATRRRWSVT